ncbi:MAG: TRIC cation channel family protein [Actinomycetaceae bacterium]|nr:TRIC cation channel family protein [Actinomycetaceae bacterium]
MEAAVLFRIVDVTGVIANGLLGGALARSKNFDVIGFLALGIASALGGGMIRDMLLGQGFPVALTDPWYLSGAIASATLLYFINIEGLWWHRALVFADVLVLGCWSATGASKALTAGLGWIPAVFLGVITAVAGGMLRDVLVNRMPSIFGGNPLYATFSILAATQMVILQSQGYYTLGMASAIVLCAVFGLLARRFKWILPRPFGVNVSIKFPQQFKNQKPSQD